MLRGKTSQGAARFSARRAGSICLLVFGASACAGPPVPVPGFFRFDRREADAFLQRNGVKQEWVSEAGRDSTGAKLHLYGFSDAATIVDARGKRTIVLQKPSSVAYLNDEGQWAAWLTPGEAHFVGWTRPAKRLWVDHGARHYLLETKEGTLELGTTDGRLKQPLDGGFHPLRIFAHDGKVQVFAVAREAKETRCLVFRETDECYELEKAVVVAPFEFPVSVVDMDLSAERVVLNRSLDLRPRWLLFDFRTGKLKNIGTTSDFGLFLKEDLLGQVARLRADASK
jgi:hypothetical protein